VESGAREGRSVHAHDGGHLRRHQGGHRSHEAVDRS